jgi:hypothetical protein
LNIDTKETSRTFSENEHGTEGLVPEIVPEESQVIPGRVMIGNHRVGKPFF